MKEVKTAIYCCLPQHSSLSPPPSHMIRGWLPQRQTRSAVFWPHTSSSHSAAPSEVYLAWWRTGGETVWWLSPPLPPAPLLPARPSSWTWSWPHSCLCSQSQSVSGFWASTMLIPKCISSLIFLDLFLLSLNGTFVLGATDASATFVNIYGCVLYTREAFTGCIKAARIKMSLHFMADCFSPSVRYSNGIYE